MYYSIDRVEVHKSARRHRVGDDDILHAAAHPLVVVDVESEGDPPKLFVIGPSRAGNLLEVVMLILVEDRLLAIHAMRLQRRYYELLPEDGHDDG
jgi:hypothetical protein